MSSPSLSSKSDELRRTSTIVLSREVDDVVKEEKQKKKKTKRKNTGRKKTKHTLLPLYTVMVSHLFPTGNSLNMAQQ